MVIVHRNDAAALAPGGVITDSSLNHSSSMGSSWAKEEGDSPVDGDGSGAGGGGGGDDGRDEESCGIGG